MAVCHPLDPSLPNCLILSKVFEYQYVGISSDDTRAPFQFLDQTPVIRSGVFFPAGKHYAKYDLILYQHIVVSRDDTCIHVELLEFLSSFFLPRGRSYVIRVPLHPIQGIVSHQVGIFRDDTPYVYRTSFTQAGHVFYSVLWDNQYVKSFYESGV